VSQDNFPGVTELNQNLNRSERTGTQSPLNRYGSAAWQSPGHVQTTLADPQPHFRITKSGVCGNQALPVVGLGRPVQKPGKTYLNGRPPCLKSIMEPAVYSGRRISKRVVGYRTLRRTPDRFFDFAAVLARLPTRAAYVQRRRLSYSRKGC